MQLIRYTVADSEFSFNLEAAYERQDSGWEKRKIEGERARAREFTCILLCAIPSFYTFSLFSCFLLLLLMFFRLVLLVCFWDIYFFRASIHDDFHLVCIISMIVQRLSVHKNAIESGPYTHSTYTFHKLNALTCLITKKNDLWVLLLCSVVVPFFFLPFILSFWFSEAFVFGVLSQFFRIQNQLLLLLFPYQVLLFRLPLYFSSYDNDAIYSHVVIIVFFRSG